MATVAHEQLDAEALQHRLTYTGREHQDVDSSVRLALVEPRALSPAMMLHLQRTVGNRALAGLLSTRARPAPATPVQRRHKCEEEGGRLAPEGPDIDAAAVQRLPHDGGLVIQRWQWPWEDEEDNAGGAGGAPPQREPTGSEGSAEGSGPGTDPEELGGGGESGGGGSSGSYDTDDGKGGAEGSGPGTDPEVLGGGGEFGGGGSGESYGEADQSDGTGEADQEIEKGEHRANIHCQGSDIDDGDEPNVGWSQSDPITKGQGQTGLESVINQCTSKQRKKRESAFEKAKEHIDDTDYTAPPLKMWSRGKPYRVDIEHVQGRSFK